MSDGTKTWFLEVIWVKMCCFWPVEVSETHFWNFWSMSWGPKHGPQGQKKTDFGFQTCIFSRAWKWIGGLPNNFSRFFGMYLSPPDHPKCPGFGLWVYGISRKRHPFRPVFGVAILEFEYPVLEFEYRKRAGISRVNIFKEFYTCTITYYLYVF